MPNFEIKGIKKLIKDNLKSFIKIKEEAQKILDLPTTNKVFNPDYFSSILNINSSVFLGC